MILIVSLDLPGDGICLRIAQRIGHILLEDLGGIGRDIYDIEFIVGELCTSVVRHAQMTGESWVLLTQEYHADRAAIIVENRGKGFSARDQGVRRKGVAPQNARGCQRRRKSGRSRWRRSTDDIRVSQRPGGRPRELDCLLQRPVRQQRMDALDAVDHLRNAEIHDETCQCQRVLPLQAVHLAH